MNRVPATLFRGAAALVPGTQTAGPCAGPLVRANGADPMASGNRMRADHMMMPSVYALQAAPETAPAVAHTLRVRGQEAAAQTRVDKKAASAAVFMIAAPNLPGGRAFADSSGACTSLAPGGRKCGLTESIDEPSAEDALEGTHTGSFDPSTNFHMDLPEQAQKTEQIIGIPGRQVSTIPEHELKAGAKCTVDADAAGLVSAAFLFQLLAVSAWGRNFEAGHVVLAR